MIQEDFLVGLVEKLLDLEPARGLKLANKLRTNPHGLEIANLAYQAQNDRQTCAEPDSQFVAIALRHSETLGIEYEKRPYFKNMTNKEIQRWITQNSE